MPITIFQDLNINSWINDNIVDCGNSVVKPTDELLDFDFDIDFTEDENMHKKLNNNYKSNKDNNNINIKNEWNRAEKKYINNYNKIVPGSKKLSNFYYKTDTYRSDQKKISYNRIIPTQKTTSHKKLHRYINPNYYK